MGTAHATVGQIKSYKGNETAEERGRSVTQGNFKVWFVPMTAVPCACGDALEPEHQRHTINTNLFRLRLDIIVEAEMQEEHRNLILCIYNDLYLVFCKVEYMDTGYPTSKHYILCL